MSDRVLIFGTWDLFHVGHLRAIKKAKTYGDCLIVGVESDRLAKISKGKKPIINEAQRKEIIKNIQGVNEVFIYDDRDYLSYLLNYQVDILMWNPLNQKDYHKSLLWEITKHNIRKIDIEYTPSISTTIIRDRIILSEDLKSRIFPISVDE